MKATDAFDLAKLKAEQAAANSGLYTSICSCCGRAFKHYDPLRNVCSDECIGQIARGNSGFKEYKKQTLADYWSDL